MFLQTAESFTQGTARFTKKYCSFSSYLVCGIFYTRYSEIHKEVLLFQFIS